MAKQTQTQSALPAKSLLSKWNLYSSIKPTLINKYSIVFNKYYNLYKSYNNTNANYNNNDYSTSSYVYPPCNVAYSHNQLKVWCSKTGKSSPVI